MRMSSGVKGWKDYLTCPIYSLLTEWIRPGLKNKQKLAKDFAEFGYNSTNKMRGIIGKIENKRNELMKEIENQMMLFYEYLENNNNGGILAKNEYEKQLLELESDRKLLI